MTQYEAEGLCSILKRRQADEKTEVEKRYEADRKRLDFDQRHAIARITAHINEAQQRLVEAKDDVFKAKGKPEWKEKALAQKAASAVLSGYYEQLQEVRRWYKDEFRRLLDRRDQEFRRIVTKYSIERESIRSQIVYPSKEENVNYWKQKFYAVAEELRKLKEEKAA